jgi:hypothetical protein
VIPAAASSMLVVDLVKVAESSLRPTISMTMAPSETSTVPLLAETVPLICDGHAAVENCGVDHFSLKPLVRE